MAFRRAVEQGFPIELDIRKTSDNHIVVYHDQDLLRLTGLNQRLETVPLRSIKALRLKGTEYQIPLFVDILEVVAGKIPILIDIKSEEPAGAFEREIYEILRNYSGKFAVESFNPHTLQWFKSNASHILRGRVGYDHHADYFPFLRRYLIGRFLNGDPDFVAYDIRCRPYWAVQFYRRKGITMLGWTAKSEKQLAACRKHFDNLMFEGFIPRRSLLSPHSKC